MAAIDRPDSIRGAVEALGRRHAGYNVRDEHYATVGAALLWTLEQGLGDAFTPEVRDAWSAVYGWLAYRMQSAAAQHTQDDRGAACKRSRHRQRLVCPSAEQPCLAPVVRQTALPTVFNR